MTWNYRVVVEGKETEEEWWSIRDVYYNDSGEICAISGDGIAAVGAGLQDLKIDIELMIEAFNKDVIIFDDDFVFAECHPGNGEEEE